MRDDAPGGRRLTRRQFDEVIRKASEMAAHEAEQGEGDLAESEVYRIAREVGLGERYVRRALGEVRSERPESSFGGRLIGPGALSAARVVDGTPAELGSRIDHFLVDGRRLQQVRRTPRFMQYRASDDWISQLTRAASGTARRYHVAGARSVEVALEPLEEGRTVVELEVDPGLRDGYVGGTLAGMAFGGLGGGVGVAISTALVVPDAAAFALGAAAAAGIAAGVLRMARAMYRTKVAEVRAEVEGVLDRLEMGDEIEPSAGRAWQQWLEKQVKGARRLLGPEDG